MKIQLLEKTACFFPYLVLFAYIVGAISCYVLDMIGYLINGSIMAIPVFIASVAFVLIKKNDINLLTKVTLFPYSSSMSVTLFLLAYTFSILLLFAVPVEPKLSLAAVLIPYAIIFIQILSRRILPAAVLFEIMLILAVTIYSYTLRSALYFGATDIMQHIHMSTVTSLSGHVLSGELGDYAHFPLYHIFMALSSNILGLDIQTALFITTCLIYITTVLLLYLLVNGIFQNEQISLMIVLVYAMNADVIYYGTYMVTRTLAYVGFLILLYLLYSLANPKTNPKHAVARPTAQRFCVVITSVFILLAHQISTPMIIAMLGLLFGLELFIRDRRHVNLTFLMVLITLFACYWTFTAYSFVEQILPRANLALYQNMILSKVVNLGLSFLVDNLDTLLVVFFGVIGMLYLIWKQQPRSSIIFGMFGLIAILLNVPNVLSVVFQFMQILRIDRFAILFLPFLAIVVGVGIYILIRHLSTMNVPLKLVGTLLIALVVLYGIGSLGLVKHEPSYQRYSFEQDEMTGFNHVLETVPSDSSLFSDYYTSRFFTRQRSYEPESSGLPYYTLHWMQDNLTVSGESGYIVIPYEQFRKGGLLYGKGDEFDPENYQPYLPTEENVRYIALQLSSKDKIYSNEGIDLYRFMR